MEQGSNNLRQLILDRPDLDQITQNTQKHLEKVREKQKPHKKLGVKAKTALFIGTGLIGAGSLIGLGIGKSEDNQTLPVTATESGVTSQEKINHFNELLKPFIDEATRRREEKTKKDPEYALRVDQELNKDRINFLIFGYGQEYNPAAPNQPYFGSHTIISYNQRSASIDIISLTHDIRAPEIERYQKSKGQSTQPTRIDKVYEVGGFDLMNKTLEDATGVAIDFQIRMEDGFIRNFIDSIMGQITVDVPFDINVLRFYQNGKEYPPTSYTQGEQIMNGTRALQFIKSWADPPEPSKERNIRKHIVLDAIAKQVGKKIEGVMPKIKLATLFQTALINGDLKLDFNEKTLLLGNLDKITRLGGGGDIEMPRIERRIFVVDPAIGDGGVQWITANAAQNPQTRDEIEKYVYKDDLAMEIPFNADPYSQDLITHYWRSVRELIKEKLKQSS